MNKLKRADTEYDNIENDEGAFWSLNGALLLLGGAILGFAFYSLDSADERPLYNPWTYAVLVPIILLLLSTLLSTLVSRVVEKSMQVAFLLSVLIHLLLLVYAVNIVIFSRMWPDVFDSLAEQREQLKRETQQARQYVQIATTNQTGRKPDYLRLVPTEHQPTEVQDAQQAALQLARSDRSDLPSPKIPHTPSATQHLLQRSRPALTTPTSSPAAASLSRSELELQTPNSALVPSTLQEDQPLELAATAESIPQRRQSDQLDRSTKVPLEVVASQSLRMPDAVLERRSTDVPINAPTQALVELKPSTRSNLFLPPAATQPIKAAPPESNPSELATLRNATPSLSTIRRRLATELPAGQTTPNSGISPSENLAVSTTQIQRRAPNYAIPNPSEGASAIAIARSTAGGDVGPAAKSSMPVLGEESFAAELASDGDLRAATTMLQNERRSARNAGSRLPESGVPQSFNWDGTVNMAGGSAGRSPSQIAKENATGEASRADVAGLTGAGQAIERAALGIAAPQGALALPSASEGTASESGEVVAGAAPAAAAIARGRSDGPDVRGAESNSLVVPMADARFQSSPGLQRALNESIDPTLPDEIQPTNSVRLARADDGATRVPATGRVEVTGEGLQGTVAELFSSPAETAAARSRSDAARQLSSQSLMEIETPVGIGGLAAAPDSTGRILPRRIASEPSIKFPQFESQRFERQEVGGPLAAANKVALPKPAFQQRLERLKDRNPLDETVVEPRTELAIERGLAYLAKHQREDGSWRLQDFDTEVLIRSDTAATGLVLLAFQGAGYTHNQFKYAEQIDKAVQFLVAHQTPDGDLYIPQDPASDQNAWLYSHAIAALALCEAYGMTQDPKLRPVAQKALNFMIASQDQRRGGWRYRPGYGSDTSVTGWFMMSLKSGRLAGLEVPNDTFDLLQVFLDRSQSATNEPHLYRYNPYAPDTPEQRHGLEPTAVMTSVGLLMRLYFGWQRERSEMIAGADYLLQNSPSFGTGEASLRDTYYWYYATQVIYHMGGDHWKRWHDRLYPLLVESQVEEGEHAGSWSPVEPVPDLWARYGGRLYVTTMNLLSLEVSYRHLPLYEATAQ